MTTFWIFGALMVALALGFILPTLLRKEVAVKAHAQRDQINLALLRDQVRELDADLAAGTIDAAAHESARHELERRVAEEVQPTAPATRGGGQRVAAIAISVLLVVAVSGLYAVLGTPAGLDPARTAAPQANAHELSDENIAAMVVRLEQKLKEKPDNPQGWYMLARSYGAMGRYKEASDAFANLVKVMPNDAQVLADYADALGMAQGKTLQGEPEKIIARALQADPKNLKALSLMGSAAFERRDYPVAITNWQKILAIVPADSEDARSIKNVIEEAKALAAGKTPPAQAQVAAAPQQEAAANSAATIEGTVDIDPKLRSQVSDTDTVFVFARAPEGGPRFPLAAVRKQVKDLPMKFVLDDSMSMVADAKLSNFPSVVISARVSKTGNANPSPGDLEGLVASVSPGTKNVKVKIDSRTK